MNQDRNRAPDEPQETWPEPFHYRAVLPDVPIEVPGEGSKLSAIMTHIPAKGGGYYIERARYVTLLVLLYHHPDIWAQLLDDLPPMIDKKLEETA